MSGGFATAALISLFAKENRIESFAPSLFEISLMVSIFKFVIVPANIHSARRIVAKIHTNILLISNMAGGIIMSITFLVVSSIYILTVKKYFRRSKCFIVSNLPILDMFQLNAVHYRKFGFNTKRVMLALTSNNESFAMRIKEYSDWYLKEYEPITIEKISEI